MNRLHMELVGKSIFERSTGCGRRDQKRGDNFLTQLYLDRYCDPTGITTIEMHAVQ